MLDDLADQALLQKLGQGLPGQGASDLHPLAHDGGGDELVGGHLFQEFVVGGLVEENQVVQLVPGFSLGPLLLLGLAAASSLLLLGGFGGLLGVLLGVLFGSLKYQKKVCLGIEITQNQRDRIIFQSIY